MPRAGERLLDLCDKPSTPLYADEKAFLLASRRAGR